MRDQPDKTLAISIHALCEEGDEEQRQLYQRQADFYPRPLRGGRLGNTAALSVTTIFLSTPSARRATSAEAAANRAWQISIHALCEEGDSSQPSAGAVTCGFLSTPSARRATKMSNTGLTIEQISIHALCEEGDCCSSSSRDCGKVISIHALCEEGDRRLCTHPEPSGYFYPRPLRGGRQQKQRRNLYFQTNYTTFCTNLEEP